MVYFSWDEEKSRKNLRDHGIDFSDATAVFLDPHRVTQEDLVVDGEQRWWTIGIANGISVLLVVHLEEDFHADLFVRIISARYATPLERREYEQNRSNDIR